MSCDIDSDSFHVKRKPRPSRGAVDRAFGTKKGDRRKTVSKRPAYVNTPSQINNKLEEIIRDLSRNLEASRYGMEKRNYVRVALLKLTALQDKLKTDDIKANLKKRKFQLS